MTVTLFVEPRAKALSSNSKLSTFIPGVVYGPKFTPTKVQIDKKEFEKTFKLAGESTVVELSGLDKPVEVLIKEVIFSPIKGGIEHVDFYALDMGKEITTHVPLHFINEAPAAKSGAVIDKVMHEITVTCAPNKLPSHIDVDMTLLTNPESMIHVSDLVIPKGVKVDNHETEVVAIAKEVKEEEVLEEAKPVEEAAVVEEKE